MMECAAPIDVELRKQVVGMQKQLDTQKLRIDRLEGQLNDGLTMALCTPELRQLLEDVQKECVTESPLESDTDAAGASFSDAPQQCTTKQIRGAVLMADPEHKGTATGKAIKLAGSPTNSGEPGAWFCRGSAKMAYRF